MTAIPPGTAWPPVSQQSLGPEVNGLHQDHTLATPPATTVTAPAQAQAVPSGAAGDTANEEAPAPPGAAGDRQPFEHNFWDPLLKNERMGYLKPIGITVVMMMVVVWTCFPLYWGSLWKEANLSPNLKVLVVNRDPGQIGTSVVNALLNSNNGPRPHPTYVEMSSEMYPTYESVQDAVEPNQEYWGAVRIMENATQKLDQARSSGDQSWAPNEVVTLIVGTARNYAVVPSVVINPTQHVLQEVLAQLGANLTSSFLSSSAGNAGMLSAASRAPQTISNPIGLGVEELRPWDHPVAIAPTFVGLIYMVILTFQITMASFGTRQPVQKYLTLGSLIRMRILTPVLAYIPISLMFSLLNIAFKLPYGRNYSYGGGFMAWWCVTYTGMLVMGLVLESVITLIGPKFVGFFLILFIIANVSVANFPIELSPSFFKYGYMMPFYNLRLIYLNILFKVGKSTYALLTQIFWS